MSSEQNQEASAPPENDNNQQEDEVTLTDNENRLILDLKLLYVDTVNINIETQRNTYNMEKMLESRNDAVFEKRKLILQQIRKSNCGDTNGNIANFWLTVLKSSSYKHFITKHDEKILNHLIDVTSKLFNEDDLFFDIKFHFEENKYFTNNVLTKIYYINCDPNPNNPLTYEGAEIYKYTGCEIDWKNQSRRDKMMDENYVSFFKSFTHPVVPEDFSDEKCCDIFDNLQREYKMGYYLKDVIIPKAILFYTGEMRSSHSSKYKSNSQEFEESESEEEDSSN